MLALAVLDLPFKSPEHETASKNRAFQIQPGGPILIFHEEVKEAKKAEGAGQILLSQNFYRADSRYRQVGNERLDNFVTAEFLTATAYGCQVVLTNPTSARRKLNLLLQVPMGQFPYSLDFIPRVVHRHLNHTPPPPSTISSISQRRASIPFTLYRSLHPRAIFPADPSSCLRWSMN